MSKKDTTVLGGEGVPESHTEAPLERKGLKDLRYIFHNILEQRMRIHKDNDMLVMNDAGLLAILEKEKRPMEEERESILNSPMTLRRYRSLAAGLEATRVINSGKSVETPK